MRDDDDADVSTQMPSMWKRAYAPVVCAHVTPIIKRFSDGFSQKASVTVGVVSAESQPMKCINLNLESLQQYAQICGLECLLALDGQEARRQLGA